jgi:hypothetical protein
MSRDKKRSNRKEGKSKGGMFNRKQCLEAISIMMKEEDVTQ